MPLSDPEREELQQLQQLIAEDDAGAAPEPPSQPLPQGSGRLNPFRSAAMYLGGVPGLYHQITSPEFAKAVSSSESPEAFVKQSMADALRVGVPFAAAPFTGGMSLLGGSALMAGAGLASEAGAQAIEGDADVGRLAASTLLNAVPLVGKSGVSQIPKNLLLNVPIQAGTAATAAALADQRVIPSGLIGGGLGVGGTVAGPAIRGITRAGIGAVGALRRGASPAAIGKGVLAETFRPEALSPIQQEAQAARANIESLTAKGGRSGVEVPIGISEVLSDPRVTREMKIPGAELSEEAMKAIQDETVHFAANSWRTGASVDDISAEIWRILGGKRDQYNAATQAAVDAFSNRALRSVNDALARQDANFNLLFPGGKSNAALGNDVEALVDLSRQEAKTIWDDAYDAAKSLPEYSQVSIPADAIRDEATILGMAFAKNSDGSISAIAAPAGARQVQASAADVSGPGTSKDFLTLDQARSLVSDLSRNVRNAGVMPGVDTRMRAQLLSKVQSEIEHAVSAFPNLKKALSDANTIYRENVGRFNNSLSKGILNEVSVKGGMTPEAIVTKLTGPNAETFLADLEHITGGTRTTAGTSVGTDLSAQAKELVRNAFISQARKAGMPEGKVDFIAAWDKIRNIPEPVRNKLFPDFSRMDQVAQEVFAFRDSKAALKSADKFLEADAATLSKALGAGDAATLKTLADDAINTAETMKQRMQNLSPEMAKTMQPNDLFRIVSNDPDYRRTWRVMRLLDTESPTLAKDVRAAFVDDLLSEAKGDPKVILEALKPGRAGSATAAGTTGGTPRNSAEAILGRSAVEDIRSSMASLSKIPMPEVGGGRLPPDVITWIIYGSQAATPGSKAGLSAMAMRALTSYPVIRYRLAARILTTPELRKQAMTATGPELKNVINRGLGLVIQDYARKFGWRSRQVAELEQAQAELQQ